MLYVKMFMNIYFIFWLDFFLFILIVFYEFLLKIYVVCLVVVVDLVLRFLKF